MRFWVWKCLQDGGQLQKDRMWQRFQDELWELWMSQVNSSVVRTYVIILERVKFWSLHHKEVSPLCYNDTCIGIFLALPIQYSLNHNLVSSCLCFLYLQLIRLNVSLASEDPTLQHHQISFQGNIENLWASGTKVGSTSSNAYNTAAVQ